MIPAPSNRIFINSNGTKVFSFDINQLHDQLSSAFKAHGIQNKWMADDILIALQNYMQANNFSVRTEEDLDQLHATVVKVLQDNGFMEVAEYFSNSMRDSSISFLNRKIEDEFRNLECPFSQSNVADVLNKLLNLGFKTQNISSLLVREICRLEAEENRKSETSIEIADPGEILPFGKQYVNWKWDYLQMRTAGSLFNSIRIDIHPLFLAQDIDMPVFIEISFMEKWEKLLSLSAAYLETCLNHLKDVSKIQIDYISIMIHRVENFIEFCELGENPPLLADMNSSVTAAFGGVIKKFTGVKLSSTQK